MVIHHTYLANVCQPHAHHLVDAPFVLFLGYVLYGSSAEHAVGDSNYFAPKCAKSSPCPTNAYDDTLYQLPLVVELHLVSNTEDILHNAH